MHAGISIYMEKAELIDKGRKKRVRVVQECVLVWEESN